MHRLLYTLIILLVSTCSFAYPLLEKRNVVWDAMKSAGLAIDHHIIEPVGHAVHKVSAATGSAVGQVAKGVTRVGIHSVEKVEKWTGHEEKAEALKDKEADILHKVETNTRHFVSGAAPSALGMAIGVATANPLIIAASGAGIANAGTQTTLDNLHEKGKISNHTFDIASRVSSGVAGAAALVSGVAGVGELAGSSLIAAKGAIHAVEAATPLARAGAATLHTVDQTLNVVHVKEGYVGATEKPKALLDNIDSPH